MKRAAVTPINAAKKLPPTTDQGCASGLAGTPNTNTVEAPIGAKSAGKCSLDPNQTRDTAPVNTNPTIAPTQAATRSHPGNGARTGLNRASQLRAASVNIAGRRYIDHRYNFQPARRRRRKGAALALACAGPSSTDAESALFGAGGWR
jgi:hypothetical protein